ncbi:hypothetical protein HY627_02445 [Candidatus Uhrbacteria bacterium]|nr:hypothetical protein [Candidatus Uhrbacteria bacterium]
MALSRVQGFGIGIVVLAALAAGLLWGPAMFGSSKGYSVVYLQSGEIYVGRVARFPRFKMTDTYLLKNAVDAKDPAKSNLQLVPLAESAWAPKELYLDLSNILFYGPLDEKSTAAQALANSNAQKK